MMDADYESTSGELVFMPGESIKDVYVNIFEDDITESDEEFYVDLLPVDGCDVQLLRSTVRNQTNVACKVASSLAADAVSSRFQQWMLCRQTWSSLTRHLPAR